MASWNLLYAINSAEVRAEIVATFREQGCHLKQVEEDDLARALEAGDWDAVLVEVRGREHQDFRICTHIRQFWHGPLIILVHEELSGDVVRAYERGADAHVVIPFDPRELVARVKGVLRRTAANDRSPALQRN